ncbi:hypothetical protein COO60DRAFT_1538383 [Scenedesmus sp. NREL 46B-D3]|nr:hypothetical protein COO60DRAFT_1538383 [Scenedesmus sp. NREL 46B-D3]
MLRRSALARAQAAAALLGVSSALAAWCSSWLGIASCSGAAVLLEAAVACLVGLDVAAAAANAAAALLMSCCRGFCRWGCLGVTAGAAARFGGGSGFSRTQLP